MRWLLGIFLFTFGCANRSYVPGQYLNKVSKNQVASQISNQQTVIVFLIDGLTYTILSEQQAKNNLPQIKRFFSKGAHPIVKAHTTFPSVTFTNIAGLLQEKPVHLTGAVGNKLIFKNRLVDFESIKDRAYFSEMIAGKSIFTRLNQDQLFTVSLDYGLGTEATVASGFDFQSGYAASQLDYNYLDRKKLDSLHLLLTETKPTDWPQFIFVHLVGLDFISHRFGPDSKEAMNYLLQLDFNLQSIFSVLRKAETAKSVITLLTSDHGFNRRPSQFFNIEAAIKKLNPNVRTLNESRYAGLFFLAEPSVDDLNNISRQLLQLPGTEIVAYKNQNSVVIKNKKNEIRFTVENVNKCPEASVGVVFQGIGPMCSDRLPLELQNKFYPFFIENMTSYFKAEKSADVVVIPRDDTHFSPSGRGFHGGPSADEVIVPVLVRNALFSVQGEVVPSWKLLQFIGR